MLEVDESKKSCALEAPPLHTSLCSGSREQAVILNIVCTKRQATSHSNIYCLRTEVFIRGFALGNEQ